jgi:hypothetical protein
MVLEYQFDSILRHPGFMLREQLHTGLLSQAGDAICDRCTEKWFHIERIPCKVF